MVSITKSIMFPALAIGTAISAISISGDGSTSSRGTSQLPEFPQDWSVHEAQHAEIEVNGLRGVRGGVRRA